MAGPSGRPVAAVRPLLRLDKWPWQAPFFKARGDAAAAVQAGGVRLNGQAVMKPGHTVGAGDVLTFTQGSRVRVVKVLEIGIRRGPATEAQGLYLDLDAPNRDAERLED